MRQSACGADKLEYTSRNLQVHTATGSNYSKLPPSLSKLLFEFAYPINFGHYDYDDCGMMLIFFLKKFDDVGYVDR